LKGSYKSHLQIVRGPELGNGCKWRPTWGYDFLARSRQTQRKARAHHHIISNEWIFSNDQKSSRSTSDVKLADWVKADGT
jgi:hypothetical protein